MAAGRLCVWAALTATTAFGGGTPLDGVWRSVGYGDVYAVHGKDWQTFEVTGSTCVAGFRARRVAGRGDRFRAKEGDSFSVVEEGTGPLKRLVRAGALNSVLMERVAALPSSCSPPTANTPLGNFDVFTQTFAEQYVAFVLRGVDWARRVSEQRARIGPGTTPGELFRVLSELIRPLADIHTGLEAPSLKKSFDASLRPDSERLVGGAIVQFEKSGRKALAAVTDRAYFQGRVRPFCRGQWQYGVTAGHAGYLRILQFGDYARRGGHEGDLRALQSALDVILVNPALRGLVIDLRLSFGGDDRLGLAMAGRLTEREYLAYEIQGRSDALDADRFSPGVKVPVKVGRAPRFAGPVVLLTGPITMSAAETFAQALMGRSPRVMRVGESTQGVFCDPLARHLPNGWDVELPNAVYRDAEGWAYDVRGLPPDVPVIGFAQEDLRNGRDPGLEAALRVLEGR
ncbi:MAG: S41 family peptidase [Acidobacteria bacterium]|nr:S41 family peptidase [Acidobacteriota bacterium]